MRYGDPSAVIAGLDWLTWDRAIEAAAVKHLPAAYALGANEAEIPTVPKRRATKARRRYRPALVTSMTNRDPRAIEWAKMRSALLVTRINEPTRLAVRQLIIRAVDQGRPMQETARLLRDVVGVLARDAVGIEGAFRSTLESLIESGVSYDRALERADSLAWNMREVALDRRCETIARTEIMGAENAGRAAGWADAASNGLIPDGVTKEWIVAFPCDECALLEGEQVPWDESFSTGDDMPPAHVNCKCSAVLVFPDDLPEPALAGADVMEG